MNDTHLGRAFHPGLLATDRQAGRGARPRWPRRRPRRVVAEHRRGDRGRRLAARGAPGEGRARPLAHPRRGSGAPRADGMSGADRRRVNPSDDEFRAPPSIGGFESARPVAVNFRRGWAGSPVRGDMTPARKDLPYQPEAPASESMVVAGIHSLALRARIRSVGIPVAGVIRLADRAREGRGQPRGQQDHQGEDQGRATRIGDPPRPGGFVL